MVRRSLCSFPRPPHLVLFPQILSLRFGVPVEVRTNGTRMLGLTRISKFHATTENRRIYKAFYCTACRATLPVAGRLSLALLPWEGAFLLFVLESLSEVPWPQDRDRCSFAIWRTVPVRVPPARISDAIARVCSVAIALDHADAKQDNERPLVKFLGRGAAKASQLDADAATLFERCNLLLDSDSDRERRVAHVFQELFACAAELSGLDGVVVSWLGRVARSLGCLTDLVDQIADYQGDKVAGVKPRDLTELHSLATVAMGELAQATAALPLRRNQEIVQAILHGVGGLVAAAIDRSQKSSGRESNSYFGKEVARA